jgi:murein DD-endopeptidase MepM/ murein hydrolase activator NlpD
MRRALASAAAALALTGSAQAASFVPTGSPPPAGAPVVLPSASVPNAAGSLRLPDGWTERARSPQQVSYDQLLGLWQGAGAAYGIPWQVLAAINKVESDFGRNMGPSSAGAVGWMQFMPSTWLRWGWDFDGDGFADPWAPRDSIYSAARYLAAAGGASDIAGAVYSYNHAQWYVGEVLSLAQVFGSSSTLTFELDGLEVSLHRAERRLAAASTRLASAGTEIELLRAEEQALLARARRTPLLSDRGRLRMEAAELASRVAATAGRLGELRDEVSRARQALEGARRRSLSYSFNPATAPLLASPSYGAGGYVFPVGGGAGNVAVTHEHHDYPAADIAAPEGSPVYALTNGVVTNAWPGVDPSCGIGLTMRADDGQVWTYCHLSYREPSVRVGARLPAGVEIGLVGSTGDATGPHLHLQLQPPTTYPQDEAWFRSFAGLAYRWSDSSPLTVDASLASGRVFALVSGGRPRPGGGLPVPFSAVPAVATPSSTQSPLADVGSRLASGARTRASQASAGGPRIVFGAPPAAAGEDDVVEFTRR